MKKAYWKCRWFGHRWKPIYVGKYGEWKLIATHCDRWECSRGYYDLVDFLRKTQHDFGTDVEKYFDK